MKQEDKDLLLKDLCARVPYGVKIQCGDYLFTFDKEHMGIGLLYTDFNRNPLESPKIILSGCYYGEDIKPYLFPLSSMTREIEDEIYRETGLYDIFEDDQIHIEVGTNFADVCKLFDILNKYHLDYNGLIPKGLANDATGLNIY
jgi:hypothetical protein